MNRIGIFMNFWVKNWDADHVKYIKKVSGLGFDILEFQAQALLEMDKSRMDEVRQAAKDNGIELTYSLGLNPKYDVASPDAKVREGGIEYLKRIVSGLDTWKENVTFPESTYSRLGGSPGLYRG